jgi:hypothetical protein
VGDLHFETNEKPPVVRALELSSLSSENNHATATWSLSTYGTRNDEEHWSCLLRRCLIIRKCPDLFQRWNQTKTLKNLRKV